jgi:hypothetical protein
MPLSPVHVMIARMIGSCALLWAWSAPRAVWVGFSVFCVLAICFFVLTARGESQEMTDRPRARLQALDKATARTAAFTMDVGQTVQMGSIFIRVTACRAAPELAEPESAAFVQVWEEEPPEFRPSWVFSGWMFASSPAVSAMDHAVYDVWVVSCLPAGAEDKEGDEQGKGVPS